MTHYVVQHYFQDVSGLAEDRYTNVWHVNSESGSLDAGGLLDLLNNFINFFGTTATGASTSIGNYLAPHARGTNSRCAVYAFGATPPNPPLLYLQYDPVAAFGSHSANALPAEVSCCISYAGDPVGGIPIASVRGRSYIGPLNTDASASGANVKARPSVAFRTDLVAAFKALNAQIPVDNPGTYLRQYSPTHAALHPITHWWADDAWDTQRRRGGDPTGRVTGTP